MSYRHITVLGHVGSDPQIRKLPNGVTVANFSIATSEKYKSKGEMVEKTEWWRIDVFQNAESGLVTNVVQKFVTKGSQLMVYGTPTQEEWTDKDTGQKRNGFKIRIGHPGTGLQLCGKPSGASRSDDDTKGDTGANTSAGALDDDIPF